MKLVTQNLIIICFILLHSDGPNCSNKTYWHTVVFSKLLVWKHYLYCFTIIVYSRSSISSWIKRNRKARMLCQALRDVFIETNGNVRYEDFCLKEVMSFFGKVNWRILSSGKLRIFGIEPDNQVLTERYFFVTQRVDGKITMIHCNELPG